MMENPNKNIEALVIRWCDRRDYVALAHVLPAWIWNNGLTDGWENLRDALRHAYAMCRHLPADERDILKKSYVAIDTAMQDR